jgi:hypothetical protein
MKFYTGMHMNGEVVFTQAKNIKQAYANIMEAFGWEFSSFCVAGA